MGEERKTVLFIVEGPSDKSALEKIFKKIYKRNRNIDFKFTDGDISSDPGVTKDNVEDRIYSIVDKYLRDKKLKKKDIFQVVQIFDMDGAYIPEEAISEGESYAFVYSTKGITCKNPERVKERNARKTTILNYLLSLSNVKSLPYEMYFVSCNLDHALYDEINLDIDKKQAYADAFYERFIGKEEKFIDFLESDVVNGTPKSMYDSWKYIKEGLHSVERHTNLNVYFVLHPRPDALL